MAVENTEKKSITDLTWLEFQQLRNLNLSQVREFCASRGVGGRDIDVYRMLADRDILPDIRAELVLSCVEQAIKAGTADFKHPKYELSKLRQDDIIAGYKRYPKALKKLGADIPSVVAVALGKDEKLRANPNLKFLIAAMSHNADYSYDALMAQIAEKGFNAGAGVEKLMYKFKHHLQRSEKLKIVHQELEGYQNEARRRLGNKVFPALNLNPKTVVDAALAKARGEIDNPFRPEKRISFWKGFSMGWKNRAAKNAEIKEQKKQCKIANLLVGELAAKCKESAALKDYKTYAELKGQLYSDKTASDYEKMCAKLSVLYEKAADTLIKQAEIACMAQKTSGLEAVETNSGTDILATKAKVRKQKADLGVRELYQQSGLNVKDKKPEPQPEVSLIVEPEPQAEVAQAPQTEVKPEAAVEVKPEAQTEVKLEVQNMVKPQRQPEINLMVQDMVKPQPPIKPVKKSYPLPADLASKNPHIQKAIELVRSEQYESFEAMKADKENFGKLPKYAQDTARMLYASAHHGTEWDTEKKKAAFAKHIVQKAEASAKAGLNKTSLYKNIAPEQKKASKQDKKVSNAKVRKIITEKQIAARSA